VRDFVHDYNAYKGNAYGLANTLGQTAVLKPSIRNKKLSNLFYTGQLTVPGPGVPPSIISGKIVAGELHNLKAEPHETAI
jgi:phytoene desaturase